MFKRQFEVGDIVTGVKGLPEEFATFIVYAVDAKWITVKCLETDHPLLFQKSVAYTFDPDILTYKSGSESVITISYDPISASSLNFIVRLTK